MNIPKQFEYLKPEYFIKDVSSIPVFVTVLDEFTHHYSGEPMYYIRLEWIWDGTAKAEYKIVDKETILDMLSEKNPEYDNWANPDSNIDMSNLFKER